MSMFDGFSPIPDLSSQNVPSVTSPPTSPVPTPNRMEVPNTPLRNTPKASYSRRLVLRTPVILFPENTSGFKDETSFRIKRKWRMCERLSGHNNIPLDFEERVHAEHVMTPFSDRAKAPRTALHILPTHTLGDLEVLEELGRGSYGTVKRVLTKDARGHAMKIIERHVPSVIRGNAMLVRERRTHLMLEGKSHIVQSTGFGEAESGSFLLLDLCEGGSLADDIARRRKNAFDFYSESQLWKILEDVTTGLEQMHSCKLVHCDIKPANIFCKTKEDGEEFLVGDLGHTVCLEDDMADLEPGDAKYMASEASFMSNKETKDILMRRDIFSLGATLLEAAKLVEPPAGGEAWVTLRKIGPAPLHQYSQRFNEMLQSMMHSRPEDRPSSAALLAAVRAHSL